MLRRDPRRTNRTPDRKSRNMEYARNITISKGADCKPIQAGGACFDPNNFMALAQFIMNSYYQTNGRNAFNCDFSGTGVITINDPIDDLRCWQENSNNPVEREGPPFFAERMTSTSSTNTPRSGSFDFSWIEHDNPSGLEDLQQVYRDFYIQSLGQVGMLFSLLIKECCWEIGT
ncbi:hypothetical protein AgCh_039023 [Apium graveolens]